MNCSMMDDGSLDTHLSELQNILSMRRTVLAESLRSYCDNLLSFKVPLGGYFIWARLSDALPTSLGTFFIARTPSPLLMF
jgi:DNA-binding transcriptional MocR family regulator